MPPLIKLPGNASETPSPSQISDSAMPLRRKSVKRRMLVESEDEEDKTQPSSRSNDEPETPKKQLNPGRSSQPMEDIQTSLDFEHDEAKDGGPQSGQQSNSKPTKNLAKSRRSDGDALPPKKKARVFESESEEEEEYVDEEELDEPVYDDDDDEFMLEDVKPSHIKGKANNGKEIGSKSHGARKKTKTDSTEPRLKNQRRKSTAIAGDTPQTETGTKRPRPKSSLKMEETVVDVVGDSTEQPEPSAPSNGNSPSHHKETSPVQPVPKKRKLPTIKKNKLATPAGSNTPSSSIGSKLNPALATKPPIPEPSKSSGIRKPAATAGNADLDLTDMNVYAELFKNVAGAPRTASNRRTKDEERRKELDKMREEARTKRAEEAMQSFDLQAQLDKISRFEERLRFDRSAALYPNYLAGKWRGEWEQDRKKRKDLGGQVDGRFNGREEGEASPAVTAR